jgi:hypothetical protein
MYLAERVVLNAAARQVVHRISKPLAAAAPHHDLLTLAALFRYGRNSAMSAESIVIPLRQGVRSFSKEIRGYEAPESW